MILRERPASAEKPSARSSVPIKALSRSLARRGCGSRLPHIGGLVTDGASRRQPLTSPGSTGDSKESGMHFGGAMFFTDYSMSAPELARTLEERGFESVWAPEHSHI